MPAAPPPAAARPGFAAALSAGPLVLDGGLSNQLADAGHDLSDALWSARLLADAPEAVVAAHLGYFRAGAQVAITASYQASFEGFARRGIGRKEAERLLALSVRLAREAARQAEAEQQTEAGRQTDQGRRAEHEQPAGAEPAATDRPGAGTAGPLFVAASVGPYGAVLADGSEYRGRYGLGVAELERFHRPRLEVLAAAGPDVLALETVPDMVEAEALLRAIEGLGVPAWLSFSVEGDRTRAGQPLEDALGMAAGVDGVLAVGVNCCSPADADRAVPVAARTAGLPVVVYPNSGEVWDAAARDWRGGSTFRPERVAGWLADGARLVGGCCRVGEGEIAGLARAVRGAG
ncbi:homocysteine S-methyltransferase [Kitasatospora sp. DSM 101779]|uniref:homocysteine S-methyltransferase n=1 Tax=Kitasatospora sp. DSM 101779 TaxID=2853165 RepID=UPI0021DB536B|nr:homocysteine S-methyltransferase [Kitasatospora sp. DSM 101779]MCU7825806.1 homocysteine S-methyltransferase [Kitasatospora sp. DSM 101779]